MPSIVTRPARPAVRGDIHDDVIDLAADLSERVVSGEQGEAILPVVDDYC
jgi:hypothetical protein